MFSSRLGLGLSLFPSLRSGYAWWPIRWGKVSPSLGVRSAILFLSVRVCIGQPLPPIPYDAYHLCIFVRHRALEIAYTSISLFYGAWTLFRVSARWHPFLLTLMVVSMADFLAFSLMMFFALRWGVGKLRIPTIMGTIAEDSLRYFLVIFTSHFVLEMTLLLGRVSVTSPLFLYCDKRCLIHTRVGIYSTTSS